MAGFFRLILAFLAATVIAFGVPRDAGREVALHVRWERHLGDAVPGISGDSSASDRTVVVSSSDRFALLSVADGAVRAGGIRTDVFTASSAGFINQSSSVPRWAVQSWAGDILSIVPNRGDPHLRDTILAQFSGDGTVWVEDIETGNEYLVDLPPDSTVYDLTLRSGGEPWIAAGSLRGELLVAGPDDEVRWRRTFRFSPYADQAPVVYAVRFAPWDSENRRPRLLALQGLNPQQLLLAETADAGMMDVESVATVPDRFAVRWPASIEVDRLGRVVVGLRGAVLIAAPDSDEVDFLEIPGALTLDGVVEGAAETTVLATSGLDGAIVTVTDGALTTASHWSFPGVRVAAIRDDPDAGLVVLQTGESIVALEARL